MINHTPGPWSSCGIYIHSLDGDRIAYMAISDRQALEDARLIAAAPDLLEALQRLLNWGQRFSGGERAEDVAFARQAVAKALGEKP